MLGSQREIRIFVILLAHETTYNDERNYSRSQEHQTGQLLWFSNWRFTIDSFARRVTIRSIVAGRLARRLSFEMCKRMKLTNFFIAVGCALFLFAGSALAADKQVTTKQTCCELAAAKSKDCRHKCCVAAHRDGKSCAVCNPQQQDLKLKRYSKKAVKSAEATTQK